LITLEHDATGDSDVISGFVACFKRAVCSADFTKIVGAVKPVWIWVSALCPECFNVVEATSHLGGKAARSLGWIEIVAVFG
jgi:hypothetical protein